MAAQVALKRQQAAEDAIALGLRMQRTEQHGEIPKLGFLAPGPVFPAVQDFSDEGSEDISDIPSCSKSSLKRSLDEPTSSDPSDPGISDSVKPDEDKKKHRPDYDRLIRLLQRLFPTQKKEVLRLVLEGCNGDAVRAIEQCLAVDDTRNTSRQSVSSSESGSSSHLGTKLTEQPTPTSPAEFFRNLTSTQNAGRPLLPSFPHYMPPPSLFLPCLYPGLAGLGATQLNSLQDTKWKTSS